MEAAKRLHPSLPENYVTLLDLRERWMEQQKQKKRDECNQDKELPRNVEVQDDLEREKVEGEVKGVDDDAPLEQLQPAKKWVVRSNPNPNRARPSHGYRRPTKARNCHWVQVSSRPNSPSILPASQPKQGPVVTRIKPKRAPSVQSSQPKPAPVVQVVEQKAASVLHASQSKPPSLEAPKVESAVEARGEIHGSDKKVDDRKLDGANMEKKKKKKKKQKRNKKRNQEGEGVVESQQEKGILDLNGDSEDKENLEQGGEVGKGNKDVDDISRVEIEEKLEGLSLSTGRGESSSSRSMAVRNRRGWRKDGGYGKFERRFMFKKERANRESGLVWVKKEEASEIDAVPVEQAGNMRV